MEKSKVYFTNLRTDFGDNLLIKLNRLIENAGIDKIDFNNKFVAIKIHFGEPGNLAFLRPNWAKVVVDKVKELGGKPFLTDCNTLYVGGRKNALDHLDSAFTNGFSPFSTGCHAIIADGLKGTDDIDVPVVGGKYVKEAHIGRAIMDADIFISLNHFKGHEATGFGGALKNTGMGCGSRRGKMEMHNEGKPHVLPELCVSCGRCVEICAHDAPNLSSGYAIIDQDKCVGCGRCIGVCLTDAVVPGSDNSNDMLNCKMMEYSKAILDKKPNFHISLAIDISPYCDCHSENDAAITPNIGMFASFDPVALDRACADACNAMPAIPNSLLGEAKHTHHDHFCDVHPSTSWQQGLNYAEEIGLGKQDYDLITIK